MALSVIVGWVLDKVGGAIIGEKVKKHLPWLNKARRDVEQARKETADRDRDLGKAGLEIDILIEENEYLHEVIAHLKGCIDNLKDRCAMAEGVAVRDDFCGPIPKRRPAAQRVKAKRGR